MDEIEEQTDSNKRCLRQLHKGGMLRLEWIIECFSFFSSSFEVYLKSSPKIKRIWIGLFSLHDESQGGRIKSLFSFGAVYEAVSSSCVSPFLIYPDLYSISFLYSNSISSIYCGNTFPQYKRILSHNMWD